MRTASQAWAEFYRVVARIPRGRVATYAQVALLAGRPRAARQVGYALAALRGAAHRVPWQRVLGRRGGPWAGISLRDPMGAAAQRALLEREGVRFDDRERVSLAEHGWRPRAARPPPGLPPPRGGTRASGRRVSPPSPASRPRCRERTRRWSGRS